jgi:ATP phosphoribosyltransferase
MNPKRNKDSVSLSLPSRGRLADDTLAFLAGCGLKVHKPNPRQYEARIPALPELAVLFQRPADIVTSVREGSVDFGVTGLDVIEEQALTGCSATPPAGAGSMPGGEVLVLHDDLSYGQCTLQLAVPESWEGVRDVAGLWQYTSTWQAPLRVATKYPNLTGRFLSEHGFRFELISAEGALEAAPAIGYADIIADLVSSGQTLRDNRLRPLPDGAILPSRAALVANLEALRENPQTLQMARTLLEFIEAHLRASENLSVFANMRGASPEAVARRLFGPDPLPDPPPFQPLQGTKNVRTEMGEGDEGSILAGLQGPTISRVLARDGGDDWFAVNVIVKRSELARAVSELRQAGGSGVVVVPVAYIFEEEPPRYRAMLEAVCSSSTTL